VCRRALSRVVGSLFAERSSGRAEVGCSPLFPKIIIVKKLRHRNRNAEPTIPTHDSWLRNARKVRCGQNHARVGVSRRSDSRRLSGMKRSR
jgi:hypothetical protein